VIDRFVTSLHGWSLFGAFVIIVAINAVLRRPMVTAEQ